MKDIAPNSCPRTYVQAGRIPEFEILCDWDRTAADQLSSSVDTPGASQDHNKRRQFCIAQLLETVEIVELLSDRVIGAEKPVTLPGRTMNTKRPTNSVAELSWLEFILARKYLNALRQTGAFHWYRNRRARL